MCPHEVLTSRERRRTLLLCIDLRLTDRNARLLPTTATGTYHWGIAYHRLPERTDD